MKYLDLVNDANCNIFTDASFKQQPIILKGEEYIANVTSPGANIYTPSLEIVDSIVNIVHNSTTPKGELIGILYGLELGYKHVRPGQVINIFSDSQVSVKGAREWVFNWINNQQDGFLYGYDSLVANQIYFLGIVYTVLRHNIPVRFYHVRGHMNYMKYKDRRIFRHSFENGNKLNTFVSDMFLTYLMKGNELIDNTVRLALSNTNIQRIAEYWFDNPMINTPLDMMRVVNTPGFIQSLDMVRYKELIGV